MSKLSMFKLYLPFDEAAVLLTRLIGETVTVENLADIFNRNWFPAFRSCFCELIPLIDVHPGETAAQLGKRNMEIGEDDAYGFCHGFHYPCNEAFLDGKRIAVLETLDKKVYALRDANTDAYLTVEEDEDAAVSVGLRIETNDIYALAEIANGEKPRQTGVPLSRQAETTSRDNKKFFNLHPDVDVYLAGSLSQKHRSSPIEDRASPMLTIAALLKLAMDVNEQKRTQGEIAEAIQELRPDWPLSDSNLQKLFADANKAALAQGGQLPRTRRKKSQMQK